MSSSQRFVIAAIIVLALVGAVAYGIGVWSLQLEPPVTVPPVAAGR
jgi:hypothetical protein